MHRGDGCTTMCRCDTSELFNSIAESDAFYVMYTLQDLAFSKTSFK